MEYKAYSFDLDDNLLKLPTLIFLKDKGGKIKEFSTLEFEKVRPKLGELGLRVFADSFKDFREDKQFLIDMKDSKKAGSWVNLVNCVVQHASIFAIITARGNSPSAIKKGMKSVIMRNLTKLQLKKFSLKFSKKYNVKRKSIEGYLDAYLDLCKFYPVNNEKIGFKFKSKDVSELKSLAFEDFQSYVRKYVGEKFGEKTNIKIGFSDDSIFHLKKMVNNILKKKGLFFYQTSDDGKSGFV